MSFGALGMTALLFAVDSDYAECVRELLYAGASPDCPSWWQGGSELVRTPLVTAMLNNSLSSLRLLLQAGCRLDIASHTDCEQVMMPSDLLATGQCTGTVERLLMTAATAAGLEVGLQCCTLT